MNLQDKVSTIMTKELYVVEPTTKLQVVKDIMDQHHLHHVPVVVEKKLVGIVSQSDLLYFLRAIDKDSREPYLNDIRLKNYSVEEVMTRRTVSLNPADKIETALEVFEKNLFHALPVIEKEILVGIVTTHDIIKALLEKRKLLA